MNVEKIIVRFELHGPEEIMGIGGKYKPLATRDFELPLTKEVLVGLMGGNGRVNNAGAFVGSPPSTKLWGEITKTDVSQNPPVFKVKGNMENGKKSYLEALKVDGWIFTEKALNQFSWY